jgi:iron complex outermembrane receptor protein
MLNFKPSRLTLALLSSGFIALSLPALAEEVADESTKTKIEDIEVITVKGFRGSLIESINTKRYSSSVVESISAEDIGKLPDSSIAESLARLPGLAAQRLDGRASKVSIRGFGEDEGATTFNGREQVSIGENRGVEFDLYPSEIMSGVTVYKTPDASLEGEGIAGVIDMQTIKPLGQAERVLQFNGQFEKTSFDKLNPDGDDAGFRGTFAYMDKFADDTVGVAFAYSKMSSPNQEKRWNAWGYPDFTANDGTKRSILGGAKPFVRSSTLERDSTMLVVEVAASEQLLMTFDALYVDFSDEKILRGIEVPFAWGQGSISGDTATVDPSTGFVTSAITQGQRVVVRNDFEERKADLMSFGFNSKYDLSDRWDLEFDASYSKVERKTYSVESYSGTGRGDSRGAADNIGYTFDGGNTGAKFSHGLDYSDYNLIKLGGPLSWGASSALNDKFGLKGTEYENQAQDGFINAPSIDDELKALKFFATQELDNDFISQITYGTSYREREKTKVSEGFFMTLSSFSYPNNPGLMTIPDEYRQGSVSLDFIGMGNMVAYDTRALIRDGFYDLTNENTASSTHATKSWSVNEKVMSLFVKADIDAEIAGYPVTGNVGLRYSKTDVRSKGTASGASSNGEIAANPTNISHDYSHLLPSLNLSMKLDDDQKLRFGVAKTISRARLDQMNASVSAEYGLRPDENGNYWKISGGNPKLEPKEALGIDLTYENYFSDEGYFSVAYFWKDLSQWIFDGNYQVDLVGVADPSTGIVPANSGATGSGKVNGGDGTLSGYEVSVTFPFKMVHENLDGFGLIASYTGVDSDMKDQNDKEFELPGLSDSIINVTGYYERNGFQARVSMRKRDDFKGDVYGIGFNTEQVNILGETIIDAQIGYDFGEAGYKNLEGLSIFLQGYNLTEEPFTSLQGDSDLQVRDYQDYGKSYLLGFSYKM